LVDEQPIQSRGFDRLAAEEKVQGLLTIACDKDAVRQLLLPKSMQGKLNIVLIVFHQQ